MFELEKMGYIKQPHTSAGRIPTDLGYRKYVDNMIWATKIPRQDILTRAKRYFRRKSLFEDVIETVSHMISSITRYTGLALSPRNRFYFNGVHHMLEHPEFRELELAHDFLKAIEEKESVARLMNQDLEITGTAIHIGRENVVQELRECTVITSTYKYRDEISGNIGLIGPMRMRYDEIVPIVENIADMTTELLTEIQYE
jgi:transcriptional regulator of heat shock response